MALVTKTLPDMFDFTRASGGGYFDSTGKYVWEANSNTPRLTYDPLLFTRKGILLEGQRTNLLKNSSTFDSGFWAKNGLGLTIDALAAPDGTSSADLLVEDTSTGFHQAYQVYTAPTGGEVYTFSVFIKSAGRDKVTLLFGGSPSGLFDLSALTATPFGAGIAVNIASVGNGWCRCSISAAVLDNTGRSYAVRLSDNTGVVTYTGDGARGVYVWGAQLESGASPTSYIPTTTAQVTRSADNLLLADVITTDPVWSREIGTWIINIVDATALQSILVCNGVGIISDVSGTGSVILAKKSQYVGDVYVDGVYAYTIDQYHGVDLNALTNLVVAEAGDGRGCISRVRFFPRIMSPAEIADIGVA